MYSNVKLYRIFMLGCNFMYKPDLKKRTFLMVRPEIRSREKNLLKILQWKITVYYPYWSPSYLPAWLFSSFIICNNFNCCMENTALQMWMAHWVSVSSWLWPVLSSCWLTEPFQPQPPEQVLSHKFLRENTIPY